MSILIEEAESNFSMKVTVTQNFVAPLLPVSRVADGGGNGRQWGVQCGRLQAALLRGPVLKNRPLRWIPADRFCHQLWLLFLSQADFSNAALTPFPACDAQATLDTTPETSHR